MSAAADAGRRALVRLMALAPPPLLRALAGRPVRIDGQVLDPQVQIALRLQRLSGGSDLLPVEQARARRRHDATIFAGPRIEVERTERIEIPTGAGSIEGRLYVPAGIGSPAPLIVYFHGGGHVVGDLDTHDQPCRFFAREVPALVLAVDYRLGPEHRFPAAVEDAFAAFRWAHDEAEELGADRNRIAVAGDSAGANLAAVVAQLAAGDDGPAPCFQLLIYPVTDLSSERHSYELFGQGFFLTREEMTWFREHYLAREEDRLDPRASPLLAADLSGVAPAHVVTAGFDPLRDEGEAYAERLREAGVATTLTREPDLVHGFINAVALGGRAREAGDDLARALREGLQAG